MLKHLSSDTAPSVTSEFLIQQEHGGVDAGKRVNGQDHAIESSHDKHGTTDSPGLSPFQGHRTILNTDGAKNNASQWPKHSQNHDEIAGDKDLPEGKGGFLASRRQPDQGRLPFSGRQPDQEGIPFYGGHVV